MEMLFCFITMVLIDHDGFNYCKQGKQNLVEGLLRQGINLNGVDIHGNTMLYYACLCGHFGLVHFLSEKGARDCKHARCYLNALSLSIRRLLKTYNNYSFATMKKASDEEKMNDDNMIDLLFSFVRRNIFKNIDENGEEPKFEDADMVLTIKFQGENSPTQYQCHKWILLSRWPQILKFTHEGHKLPVFERVPSLEDARGYYYTDQYIEETSSASYTRAKNNRYTESRCKEEALRKKKELLVERETSMYFSNLFHDDIDEFIKENITQDNYTEYLEKLSNIDLGTMPFTRKQFEILFTWMYCGKLIDPKAKNKSQFYPASVHISSFRAVVHDLIIAAYALELKDLTKFLLFDVGVSFFEGYNDKKKLEEFVKTLNSQLQDDLCADNYMFEKQVPTSILDTMKRALCNVKLGVAEDQVSVTEHCDIKETSDYILCNKIWLTKRSPYFEIIMTGNFLESIEFKKQEESNEVPAIELQQCSQDVLTQLMTYTYCEKANITKSNVIELSIQAQKLEYFNLYKKCEEFMFYNLTIDDVNMFELFKVACYLGSTKLKKFLEPKTIAFLSEEIRKQNLTWEDLSVTLYDLDCSPEEVNRFDYTIKEKLESVTI